MLSLLTVISTAAFANISPIATENNIFLMYVFHKWQSNQHVMTILLDFFFFGGGGILGKRIYCN